MVKTSPSNVGDVGLIPGQEAEISHASSQNNQNVETVKNIVTNSLKSLKMVHIKKKKVKTQRCNNSHPNWIKQKKEFVGLWSWAGQGSLSRCRWVLPAGLRPSFPVVLSAWPPLHLALASAWFSYEGRWLLWFWCHILSLYQPKEGRMALLVAFSEEPGRCFPFLPEKSDVSWAWIVGLSLIQLWKWGFAHVRQDSP